MSAIAALRLKHKREHFTMIEGSNADKEFIEGVILQMIKDGIIINKKSLNEYDSFYRKLSTDNDNINPSQQPSATNAPSCFLSDTFTPPQDNIKIPAIDKIRNVQQNEDPKLEVQFSALKNYAVCEISALVQKIEQIPERVNTTLNKLKQNDNRNTDMLENNISFLQQELRSKNELIKSIMDTQTIVLETISKQNQFKRPDKNLSNVLQHHHKNYIEKVHHTSQHEKRNIQEQHFNLEQKPQSPSKNTTKQHSKNNRQPEKTHNKT